MYLKRTISSTIRQTAAQFPVLLVMGPRQVGKTTCLKHVASDKRNYVTLDDPQSRTLAREEPALFLQRFPAPVLIDEIQYAPELLPLIKIAVDNDNTPGQFWLTGSQQFHLMENVSESLAGRVGILNLLGMSNKELARHPERSIPFDTTNIQPHDTNLNLLKLYEKIWRGSFPAIATNPDLDRDLFYSSYVQTYLQRDVKALTQVGDEIAFLTFLKTAAARTGQLLNMADMAHDACIAHNTAKNWLSILKTSGIIHLLQPYHANLNKRMIKSPKLYFLDTGLAAYLTEWTSFQTLEAGAMTGPIFETWVFAEIIKSYWHNGKPAPLYYYRDKDKKEIDLLIVKDGTIYPLEIKKTASPSKKDTRHFSVLNKLNLPIGPGAVICMSDKTMPITENIQAIPANAI